MAAWLLLVMGGFAAAAPVPPTPTGAEEGAFLDVDGVLYEVKDGKMVPFLPEGMETSGMTVQKQAEVVTVTASHLVTAESAAPVATKVITQDELVERGARSLADVLRQESGIQVNQSLGVGQEVYMDGLDGRTVLVLIDGRPVNGKVDNRVDLSRVALSPSNVERIEVIRGPMSALYGSDAMGGVINIITRRPRDGFSGDVTVDTVLLPMKPVQASLSGNVNAGMGPVGGRAGFQTS